MHRSLGTMRALRGLLRRRTAAMSETEFWHVPDGFNASLGWHLGHVSVTVALLTFGRCGLALPMDDDWIVSFRKGSRAGDSRRTFTREEVDLWLDGIIDRVEAAWEAGELRGFEPYETSAGVPLGDIDQAIDFLAVHDGIHVGYVLAQARAAGV